MSSYLLFFHIQIKPNGFWGLYLMLQIQLVQIKVVNLFCLLGKEKKERKLGGTKWSLPKNTNNTNKIRKGRQITRNFT